MIARLFKASRLISLWQREMMQRKRFSLKEMPKASRKANHEESSGNCGVKSASFP